MNQLFAKSTRPGLPQKSLIQHTRDVVDAVRLLFGSRDKPTRLGNQWREFFQFRDFAPFHDAVIAAAAFHDIGKANESFQHALEHGSRQAIRHEHLSALILSLDDVADWVGRRADIDWKLVLAAVASHHLKTNHEEFANKRTDVDSLRIPTASDDFQELLALIEQSAKLGTKEFPLIPEVWSFSVPKGFQMGPHVRSVRDQLYALDRSLARDEPRRRHLWAIRAALIAADAAGSAFDRLGQLPGDWIAQAFDSSRLCTERSIWETVVDPRVNQLRNIGKWNDGNGRGGWNTFQIECERQPSRSLLLAPCGSGKTLAAWRWIASQLGARPAARVIFLYPTRATATEGFRDYVSWAPEDEAALVHGTADFELCGMFENPADPDDPRQARDYQPEARLFSVALWEKRIFSATVDQFLAFLQYQYGPVCLLPLLVDSVIVIDEVHSFDRAMFSALKQFLQSFPTVRVLCMTATLPAHRRNDLTGDCGLALYNEKPADLVKVAKHPRYRVKSVEKTEVIGHVKAALRDDKRVLWVVNNVRRAQQLPLEILRANPDCEHLTILDRVPVYCYHSRFKLEHRRDRHREVVAAFQQEAGPVLAVTTQVCEMSLDLDADVLVMEMAPVTAMIQRMGRCVREALPKSGRIGDVFIYVPDDTLPYDDDILRGAAEFVAELAGKSATNQLDLEAALERWAPQVRERDKECSFLESGPYAMAREQTFREANDFTASAILDDDVEKFLSAPAAKKAGYVLPVPHRFLKDGGGRLPGFLRIAPGSNYHPLVGFCEETLV